MKRIILFLSCIINLTLVIPFSGVQAQTENSSPIESGKVYYSDEETDIGTTGNVCNLKYILQNDSLQITGKITANCCSNHYFIYQIFSDSIYLETGEEGEMGATDRTYFVNITIGKCTAKSYKIFLSNKGTKFLTSVTRSERPVVDKTIYLRPGAAWVEKEYNIDDYSQNLQYEFKIEGDTILSQNHYYCLWMDNTLLGFVQERENGQFYLRFPEEYSQLWYSFNEEWISAMPTDTLLLLNGNSCLLNHAGELYGIGNIGGISRNGVQTDNGYERILYEFSFNGKRLYENHQFETSSIKQPIVENNQPLQGHIIYNIVGQRVDGHHLRTGIYIVNGRKVWVK